MEDKTFKQVNTKLIPNTAEIQGFTVNAENTALKVFKARK